MRKEIRERYSCRRKRDYVTALAIILFILMISFQIYLIVLLPVQIKNAESLELNIVREQLLLELDHAREYFKYTSSDGPLHKGEIEMVSNALDRTILFAREHHDDLTLDQLSDMLKTCRMIKSVVSRWFPRDSEGRLCPPDYYIRAEKVDPQKYVRTLELRIRDQEKIQ